MQLGRTRSPVLSTKSIVTSSQPLASAIGNSILASGGNACDAAIGVAAALAVTEPCSTGLGGDMFALFYDARKKKVFALNGSGKSAAKSTFDLVKSTFPNEFKIPRNHGLAVTVPGCVAGWVDSLSAWGTRSLSEVLAPAISLARNGFPVSEVTAYWWTRQGKEQLEPCSPFSCFLPPPAAGDIFRNPDLADTLELIAKVGKKGFYEGRIARSICEAVQSHGGVLQEEDLAKHESSFVEPVSYRYRNKFDVFECPPNGQGLVALMALDAYSSFPPIPPQERHSAKHLHLMIECLRTSFADARKYIADPAYMKLSPEELLYKNEQIRTHRISRVSPTAVKAYGPGTNGTPMSTSNTVSFQVVDQWGNAVSMVNSTYEGFGSGICPPKTGLSLQNRASNFSLDPASANCIAGSKRPYHTIIPGMTLYAEDQTLHTSFTVMGGFMQPQGHFQVLNNMIDYGDTVQQALDRPRFCMLAGQKDSDDDLKVCFEEGFDVKVLEELRTKYGQKVDIVSGYDRALFGRGQIIMSVKTGETDGARVLHGGSDPRADGCAIPGF